MARARADVRLSSCRITYISWAPHCSRSDHTARELGGTSHLVYAARLGSHPATIVVKYAIQWLTTARILRAERPDTVFVMTPPVFAALPAFWYAWRHDKQVVIDAHTCAFVLPRWRAFQWLQMALCRRAATTLVTNDHIAELVRAAGGHATIVPDVPVVFEPATSPAGRASFTVVMVCSFSGDEPLQVFFRAAARLPDVDFMVTGDPSAIAPADVQTLPANVKLTGFLDKTEYGRLISTADVVMDLTTLDHTMLRGAYEAIYQGVPVIVSNWPVLREAFPIGAIHVENTSDSIVAGVREMQARRDELRRDAARLRQFKLDQWQSNRRAILARIGSEAWRPG